MKNKKLLYGILIGVAVVISVFMLSKFVITPTQEQIIVKQSDGAKILPAECMNKNYIIETADYIIEGTIEKVESKWNEERTSIFTYTDLRIERYVKGTPFRENKIQIVTPGGKVGEIGQRVEDQPIFYEGKKVRMYLQKVGNEFSIVCAHKGVEEIGLLIFEKIILYENGKQTTLNSFQQPDLPSKIGNLLAQEIQKINVKAKCLFTERDIQEIKQKDSAIELIFKEPRDISLSPEANSLVNVKTVLFILEDKRGEGLTGHILIGTERKERDEKCFWRITEEQQKILGFCEMIVGYEWNEQYGCSSINGCRFDPKIVPFETYEECEFTCGKIWSCWAIRKKEGDLDKSWIDKINSLLGRVPKKDEYYGRSTYGQCKTDDDCYISGCNSEICQSKAEEPLFSICILPEKPTPLQLNYKCRCINNMCQWTK